MEMNSNRNIFRQALIPSARKAEPVTDLPAGQVTDLPAVSQTELA